MPNLNKVQLMGNITRDPEVRYTPKGTAVTDISLAINRSYSGDDGQRHEETTFVDITFWGRQAEIIGEYMKKGRPLLVEGRLKLDQWEDKNTHQKQSKLKVVLESLSLIDSNRGEATGVPSAPPARPAPPPASAPASAPPVSEDDIAPHEGDDVPF